MSELKILIVEDEFIIAQNLKLMLQELGYNPLPPAINLKTAKESIDQNAPDMVILDINLKGQHDGIELGKYLNELGTPFMYLTSNADKETVELAKQTNPRAYIVKPFNHQNIYTSIEVAMGTLRNEEANNKDEETLPLLLDSLFIKSGNKYLKVKIQDITHMEADDKSVNIFTNQQQKLKVNSSLENLFKQLKDFGFARVHRSFCINSNHLTAINSESVYIGNLPIPIGRSYKEELLKRLNTMI